MSEHEMSSNTGSTEPSSRHSRRRRNKDTSNRLPAKKKRKTNDASDAIEIIEIFDSDDDDDDDDDEDSKQRPDEDDTIEVIEPSQSHVWPEMVVGNQRAKSVVDDLANLRNNCNAYSVGVKREQSNHEQSETRGRQQLEQRIKELENELEKQQKKHDAFMSSLKALVFRGSGRDPAWSLVAMHGINNLYSEAAHAYKAQSFTPSEHIDDDRIIIENIDELGESGLQLQLSEIRVALQTFWTLNQQQGSALDVCEPNLSLEDSVLAWHEVMESFVIEQHRIPSLVSQQGVRAKRDIPRCTVLGQIIGTCYTVQEYERVYAQSNQWSLRNQYAFDLLLRDHDGQGQTLTKLVIDMYDHMSCETPNIGLIGRVNDYRLDMYAHASIEKDLEHQTAVFINATINGWSSIWLMTCRNVKRGQEIAAYYGHNAVHETELEYTKLQHFIQTQLDSSLVATTVVSDVKNE